MTTFGDLRVVQVDQLDPRLGRQVVHDPRSLNYVRRLGEPTKRTFTHRVIQPRELPSQPIGCCTGVDACVKANTVGNRRLGVILDLDDAIRFYSRATQLDPWAGEYPPDDTGSSGLAACKAQMEAGVIDRYEWITTGAAGILAALQERPVGVGTWWYSDMFHPDPVTGLVSVWGALSGGHQYTVIGFNRRLDAFLCQCWWGDSWGLNGRFHLRFNDMDRLMRESGDAHVTFRKMR